MNTTLMCAAMNLKKLAIWLVKEPRIAWINRILIMILVENINLYKKTNWTYKFKFSLSTVYILFKLIIIYINNCSFLKTHLKLCLISL